MARLGSSPETIPLLRLRLSSDLSKVLIEGGSEAGDSFRSYMEADDMEFYLNMEGDRRER